MKAWVHEYRDDLLAGPRRLTALADGRTAQELWPSASDLPRYDRERLARVLDMLPPRHADVWELVSQGVQQSVIATFFGWSQPNVVNTLSRATAAVKLLFSLPDITVEDIERDLGPHVTAMQLVLLTTHFRTSSYVRTAEALGMSAERATTIQHRFNCVLQRLHRKRQAGVRTLDPYITFFEAVRDNTGAWGEHRTARLTLGEIKALGRDVLE